MKVSKRTVRNFLKVWDELSDTGPCDWQDFIELEGKDQDKEIDKLYKFIDELKDFSFDVEKKRQELITSGHLMDGSKHCGQC